MVLSTLGDPDGTDELLPSICIEKNQKHNKIISKAEYILPHTRTPRSEKILQVCTVVILQNSKFTRKMQGIVRGASLSNVHGIQTDRRTWYIVMYMAYKLSDVHVWHLLHNSHQYTIHLFSSIVFVYDWFVDLYYAHCSVSIPCTSITLYRLIHVPCTLLS